jgi:hypothetical protein
MGPSGPSHCFNCNRDEHFQASCPNPPFCYNGKKDGHKAMSCPAKKGLNSIICGYEMLGQAFYNIHILDHGESSQPKYFPGILTIREGWLMRQ